MLADVAVDVRNNQSVRLENYSSATLTATLTALHPAQHNGNILLFGQNGLITPAWNHSGSIQHCNSHARLN